MSRKLYNKIGFVKERPFTNTNLGPSSPPPSTDILPYIVLIAAAISLSSLTMSVIGLIVYQPLPTASFYLALPSMGLLETVPAHEAFI